MHLVFQDVNDAWVILYAGQAVAIGGTTYFASRDDAVAQIAKRNLVVLEDGTILRPEEVPTQKAEKNPQPVDDSVDEDMSPAERRREQNRRYYRARPEDRKQEVAERSREWWAEHPKRTAEYRARANEKRRLRYASDPEYKEKVAAANRRYQESHRAQPEPEQE